MTLVHVRLRVPSATGEAPARGALTFTPLRRRHLEAPDRVVVPAPFVAVLDGAGEADVELASDWYWQVREDVRAGIIRHVPVPDAPEVDYGDLVDIDPTTLAATAEPEAAWWTALEAAQLGVQATVDPDDPDVLILTMQSWQLDPADPLAIILPIGA